MINKLDGARMEKNTLGSLIEKLYSYGDGKKWREGDRLKYLFGGRKTDFLVGLGLIVEGERRNR